jgi:hypothetical protein
MTEIDKATATNSFQRVGAISNTHVGRDFKEAVRQSLAESEGLVLEDEFPELVGVREKKSHKFDLGCGRQKILVECKAYTWTSGGYSPSAKIRSLNEAVLLFSAAPFGYRKMLFIQKDFRKSLTLAAHYVKSQGHLVGADVEIWQFDMVGKVGERVL